MFGRILVANRGEIAVRVIRTARAMGIDCVAVHSDADAAALHVALADRAVAIGGAAPADSYLRIDRIVAAARETGAEAIHPGYGFLSENPEFVEAVEAAGLTFIGPSADAIRAMGLKDAAKRLMAEAGVPVVPGYMGTDQSPDRLAAEAEAVGYPVLIKAVAGGGGKGMRLVTRAAEFADALVAAQGEARTAFGNAAVLIEKFVETPRHIEVQVFGDGTRAVHLFERDCSLQRRHQKVIEEAPAPGMTAGMRAAMGAAAVRAAEAIGYRGAGTVEFIVDGSDGLRPDRFWFMEMNTRLQVEHPVTEMVTGIDLVEWQLRVAAGEDLPARQEDLSLDGHAFEARLYAEDVPAGFLPATGRLAALAFPDGVRAETGVRAGDTISPHYDPMIAKLVVHGPTRAVALRRLARGLAQTRVAGTVTNLAFLGALARHPGFAAGDVDTGLIARDLAVLTAAPGIDPVTVAEAALSAADLLGPADPQQGFALWQPLARRIVLRHEGRDLACTLEVRGPDAVRVHVGEGNPVEAARLGGAWRLDGAPAAGVHVAGGRVQVFAAPGRVFEIVDPLDRAQAITGENVIEAPMPGRVVRVLVEAGVAVAAGARLAVLEAMKMEHALTAWRDGVVEEVLVEEGAQVEAGAALVRLAPEEAAE
ncbi:biotin carboxylase N-terminal domain-containing protein [Roseivivax isoporae]|nr:biotin carboxylase N-terminal domain-containing protein [Roseivivax isoporae]